MKLSIVNLQVVTLSSIDEPNLVPTFNSYCWAAVLADQQAKAQLEPSLSSLPALNPQVFRLCFEEAGLLIDRGEEHYSIVATGKGGVVYHFASGQPPLIDAGIVVRNPKGRWGSSQGQSQTELEEAEDALQVVASIVPMPKQRPGVWQFLLLRLLCITIFRFPMLRERVKQVLVKLLITGKEPWPLKNRRTIRLGNRLAIHDETESRPGYEVVGAIHDFVPIHMASQGYWQLQDEGVD